MGRKTSVWLSDDLEAAWRASGLPLAELVRRGLGLEAAGGPVDEPTLRRAVREIVREEMAGLSVACSGSGRSGYDAGGYESEPFEDIP